MSCLQNEALLETIYDEVWEEFRTINNLTSDQLYTLEQNSPTGVIQQIEDETNKRFEDLIQWVTTIIHNLQIQMQQIVS